MDTIKQKIINFVTELDYIYSLKENYIKKDVIITVAKKYNLEKQIKIISDTKFYIYINNNLNNKIETNQFINKKEKGIINKDDLNGFIIDSNTLNVNEFIKKYC